MWKEILRDYDQRHRCNEDEQIGWFRKHSSLRAAIESAARALDEQGRRYSHQSRIRRESIRHATAALLAAEDRIARVTAFDELLDTITAQLRAVAGVGDLYRYDTAFRIGAYLDCFPTRVYLHAGTRVGARALGLAYQQDSLGMSEAPAELRHRAPYEVEDILCIYKGWFGRGSGSTAVCPPRRRGRRGHSGRGC